MEYYIAAAESLFSRFAQRHELDYEVQRDAPIEVLWEFPAQSRLSLPIVLGLQNGDELNFGVSDFWSYFFPFDAVAEKFERVLDAWVAGDARVAVMYGPGRLLQLRDEFGWKTAYYAGGCIFPFRTWPREFIQNHSAGSQPFDR